MVISDILDVAIGIIFIYILLSVICAAVREGIESWLKTRAAYLEHGVRQLLDDKTGNSLAKWFYEHPLIQGLYSGEYKPGSSKKPNSVFARSTNLPSYIPSKNFAMALMDLAARGPNTTVLNSGSGSRIISLDAVRANVANLGNGKAQRALLTAIDTAQGDLDKAQANLEAWYDSAMDRVSGWYRRSTQWIIFWIALVVAVGLNVNTIRIADFLYRDDATREALVETAKKAAADPKAIDNFKAAKAELDKLALPIGWGKDWSSRTNVSSPNPGRYEIVLAILGWLITAIAATLGAPLWFDVLNKVMVIRSTVKPHEKSPDEGSEDRQNVKAPVVNVINGPQTSGTSSNETPPGEQKHDQKPDENDVDATDIDLSNSVPTADDQLPD